MEHIRVLKYFRLMSSNPAGDSHVNVYTDNSMAITLTTTKKLNCSIFRLNGINIGVL
jgi:hypothetical protein